MFEKDTSSSSAAVSAKLESGSILSAISLGSPGKINHETLAPRILQKFCWNFIGILQDCRNLTRETLKSESSITEVRFLDRERYI